ncbi:MAG: Holliday junction branch migration DNA helicase RuvB [Candidatus Brocadiales bacterium]
MSKGEDIFTAKGLAEDAGFEVTLRPQQLCDFIGQEQVKENLRIYIEAAKKRGEALDHILFSGPPGLGKTTLSYIIATEIGVTIKTTSGPVLERPGDLAGLLTNLQPGEVLFIDEIHRLPRTVEEYLYSAMEDFTIDIMIDQGPSARSLKINLPRFTLIGATTREGLLTAPLRARFGVMERLDFYPWTDLYKIIQNSARLLCMKIDEKATEVVARRSRGTPRIANRFLRRVRDVAQVKGRNVIDEEVAHQGLKMLGVDENGLGAMDRRILGTIIRHGGRPVGVKTIAVSVGEEKETIEEVYEPFLIQSGYLDLTSRGRRVTSQAYQHLGIKETLTRQESLF